MKITGTVCIEAPKEQVWAVLSDVANVHLWVGPIQSAHCQGEQTSGVGTVRVCQLNGGMTVSEEWIEWNEGSSFTYQATPMPLFRSAKNQWSVQAVGEKTLLTTESEVILKGGIFGRLLEPFMRIMTSRMGSDSLAAFKFLVETGEPYRGEFRHLPRAAATC